MIAVGETFEEAKRSARFFSSILPGRYITLEAGLFIKEHSRRKTFIPTGAIGDTYWLNGRAATFNPGQKG